ncbi:hypothetical protein F542_4690 [Bibersteinia trehalosi USDA-ARS-USMARC-188]|uniref:Uncharacterized protein n=2 Tax=Bibersteinia trehalosi TaxID=47735 RepID=A0A4V7I838_BIBTR|nr:hypothetical protein WQG_17880 [Bibersteinia trehalosi USDA-ARS-USMARC-192]AHG81188.1 hypothetical protein F542_4690 [Bibersteinia trehalosi USDA-ARS-USMARC-188]AHG83401.1 hypothetical protein F543_5360 [Bibersteinia trehalosi USDA-ARS-USMARC-189]
MVNFLQNMHLYFAIANSGIISQWLHAFDKQGNKRFIVQT